MAENSNQSFSNNRHARRHGEAQQVEREIPVTILQKGDGTQEIITPETQACNACKCCIVWTQDLQFVRDSIIVHWEKMHSKFNRDLDNCPICLIASGGIDSEVVGGN